MEAMMSEIVRKIITCEVKEIGERILEFVGSTETQDRDGEVIRASGWDLKNYKKNPVFMFSHRYDQPPIGKANKVWVDNDKLKFNIEFADRNTYEFADTIYQLYKGGFMKATSVGFIPDENAIEQGDGEKAPRRTYTKQELLELSAVAVPSNPDALVQARDTGLITIKEFEAVIAPEEHSKKIPQFAEEKPYPNEHSCRLRSPDDFQADSFRRTSRDHEGKKYDVIMGRLKGETTMTEQAYRYPKDNWPAGEARGHCKEHDGTFEAATEEASNMEIKGEEKAISQTAIKDEFDFVCSLIEKGDLSDENKILAWEIVREVMRISGADIPVDIQLKVGAVLNAKNRQSLKQAQTLIQSVLDSAERPAEENLDAFEIAAIAARTVERLFGKH